MKPLPFPLVAADYYAWAYTEMFVDNADIYAWSTAGVDALGWSLLLAKDNAGLFFVNLAGLTKTIYPAAALLGAKDSGIRDRAWIALATHATTLVSLELLGRPALSVRTATVPRQDGLGIEVACRF